MSRRKICNCSKLIAAIDAYIEKADKDIEDNLKDSGFVEPKKTVKKMTELEEDLTDILEEDTKFIVSTIQDYDGVQDYVAQKWPEVQNREDVVRKLTRTFESTFNDVIPEYVESYIKRTDADLSAIALTHRTQNWINSWSSQLADLMRLSDNKNIQNILNNALQNGESVQDTANAIADSGIRSPGYRARRVATTELLRAHSVAQQESFMQSPAVEEKMWRHSGWRKYARQNHMNMDGQRVRKDLPFTLFGEEGGIHYPMYPRDAVLPPGESVNCGCIAEPIVNEYVLGMSLEERQQLQQEAIEQLDDEFDKMLDEQNKLSGKFSVNNIDNGNSGGIINTETSDGASVVTGGRILDPDSKEASKWAEGYYDEIRAKSTDYIKIAERLEIDEDKVKAIKDYLFNDASLYDEGLGVYRRFDADAAIAQSWQRLAEAKEVFPHDKTLINHELYEMQLKEEHPEWTHQQAHDAAQQKYNYRDEAEEYYNVLRQRGNK